MSPMQEKFESLLKKFLSQKLEQHVIPVEKVKEIIVAAADLEKNTQIEEEKDIENALRELDKRFHEIHELVEVIEMEKKGKDRRVFEKFVTDIAAKLVLTDMDKALEIVTYASEPEVTLDAFSKKYPEFLPLTV